MSDPLAAAIQSALSAQVDDMRDDARNLLDALGYRSQKTLPQTWKPREMLDFFGSKRDGANEAEFRKSARRAGIVFQAGDAEIQSALAADGTPAGEFKKGDARSFMFAVADLKRDDEYSRVRLARMTRAVNRCFNAPAVVLFRHADAAGRRFVSLAFVHRRKGRDGRARHVLGRVSILRAVRRDRPHRGHLDILQDLALKARLDWMGKNQKPPDFDGLLAAWLAALDTETLNNSFYRDLYAWFLRATRAKFPNPKNRPIGREEQVIRLITRLLFIWFVKEKGLVSEEFFIEEEVRNLLVRFDLKDGDYYYCAVLQNLFFATLNTEIGRRGFSEKTRKTHRDFSRYRHAHMLADRKKFLGLAEKTPFVNGGLFDCMDSEESRASGGEEWRQDYFSDTEHKRPSQRDAKRRRFLRVPDGLFFGEKGIIKVLRRYKFTVVENTPVEQEVALDPELLGNVFENLLAAYNPETRGEARKRLAAQESPPASPSAKRIAKRKSVRRKTGSYYTPRAVVDYMVDEALAAHFSAAVRPDAAGRPFGDRLRELLSHEFGDRAAQKSFSAREKRDLVHAVAHLRVLDPAVGSGAFPMGILHKLALVLLKLDPENKLWRKLQEERARAQAVGVFTDRDHQRREDRLKEINDAFENYAHPFGRKLFLIQNSIYGADIQPVACEIAKLRLFITLAIEQERGGGGRDNYGFRPLPNLETRFVAANALVAIDSEKLQNEAVDSLLAKLRENRERHFNASARPKKVQCMREGRELRKQLKAALRKLGLDEKADQIGDWDPYDQNKSAGWFEPEWMFSVRDGFDIAIGNPPYVRNESLSRRDKDELRAQYPDIYDGKADLYTYFYRRGQSVLRDGGRLCLITSNKFMRADYGANLREFLMRKSAVRTLVDFGELPVVEAGTDMAIVHAEKASPENAAMTAAVVKNADDIGRIGEFVRQRGFRLPISALSKSEWILEGDAKALQLVKKIRSKGRMLGEYANRKFHRGIITGCNDAFVIDEGTRRRLIAADAKSAEVIKPWLDGRDIKKWRGEWAGKHVLFVREDTDLARYPAVKAHLAAHKASLLARSSPRADKWFALQAPTTPGNYEAAKIVYNETSKEMHAYVDREGLYINKTGFIIVAPDNEFLLGILNSRLMDWFYRMTFPSWGDPWSDGRPQFRGSRMKQLRIPAANAEARKAIADRVRAIMRDPLGAKVPRLEAEVDAIVNRLYGLTAAEVRLVESGG